MDLPDGTQITCATSHCGSKGLISDHQGFHYVDIDPLTHKPWPKMPNSFREIAIKAAEYAHYPDFNPDSCVLNVYAPHIPLKLHRDVGERDLNQPIVSVSLGLDAVFLMGGNKRQDPKEELLLHHGDVLIFGGVARQMWHGIKTVLNSPKTEVGNCRINLTFRRAH